MKPFEQYLIASLKRHGLYESKRSIARLMHHQKYDPFVVIMSVERNPKELGLQNWPNDPEKAIKSGKDQNSRLTHSFRDFLKFHKFGFIPIQGQYTETYTDITGAICHEPVVEKSQIIYTTNENKDQVLEFCVKWAKKYNQECILYVENGKGYFLYMNDLHKELIGTFHPQKVDDYYSSIKPHKNFEFSNTAAVTNQLKKWFGWN